MAKFIATSETNYQLENLIKSAEDKLILISPYLKLSDRIKELLEDKDNLRIPIHIVYGKNELKNEEINWLSGLNSVNVSYCENLHAKCYLNEDNCIITSMNLYEFSQQNNNEMGILLSKEEDTVVYDDALEEARRIIRISELVRMTIETSPVNNDTTSEVVKITTSKLAKKFKKKTSDLTTDLLTNGYLKDISGKNHLTEKALDSGAEEKAGRYGSYFLWDYNSIKL